MFAADGLDRADGGDDRREERAGAADALRGEGRTVLRVDGELAVT